MVNGGFLHVYVGLGIHQLGEIGLGNVAVRQHIYNVVVRHYFYSCRRSTTMLF